MAQAPVVNSPKLLNLGPAELYIATGAKASLSAAKAATDWHKIGYAEGGIGVTTNQQIQDILSGFPSKPIARFILSSSFNVAGLMNEFSSVNLNHALGGPGRTITTKVSPATTVATGSTKTVVKVASATGLAVGQEIAVNTAAVYGIIKSISGTDITLTEPLLADPVTGEAVKLVDTAVVSAGLTSNPADVALKISKTLQMGTLNIYIFKANTDGNMQIQFPDGQNIGTPIGMSFNFAALSDPTVESGALAQFEWSPNG